MFNDNDGEKDHKQGSVNLLIVVTCSDLGVKLN